MTKATASTDPRSQLNCALDQLQRQIGELNAEDLHRSTPCAQYDVRTLLAHVIAVLRKLSAVGRRDNMSTVTDPAADISDGWAEEFQRARADLQRTWSTDAALEDSYTLPWGTMTGRALIEAYAPEFTVHGWDFARVTGRTNDLDPALAEAALDWYRRNVPAQSRSNDGPFGPVVEVSADADPYTRLAGYLGRAVKA